MIVPSLTHCRRCFLACAPIPLVVGSMAACRNFFDEPTSSLRRSTSLSFSPPPEGKEEAGVHCLELTLGLGPPVDDISASSPPQQDTVRPTSVYPYLQKQPSGKFESSAPPSTVDASQPSFAQFDAPKVPGNFIQQADGAVLAKQRSGNLASLASAGNGGHTHTLSTFNGQTDAVLAVKALLPSGDSMYPSRDQIWQTLQNNGTLIEQNTQFPDQASSMWSRRSASMQLMVPRKDVDDENCRIRRSCSNGVLSSHVSNIQSSLERSPQQNTVLSHYHHQEAFQDLQKRKEMQAQRRQVARKRRKILMEEKQHKKTRQSNSLQRLGSRQMASPEDKFSHVQTPSVEDDVAPEMHCVSPNESKPAKPENQGMVNMIQNLRSEDTHGMCAAGVKGNEHNHGSYSSPPPATMVTSGQAGMCVNEDEGAKSCPSSDTDCVENSSTRNDLSGQRSASEFGCFGVTVSSVLSTSGMANSLVGFRPFPFSPIPYGSTVAGATTTTMAMQPNFPFPYFTQYPVASNCEKDSSMQSLPTLQGTCPLVATTSMGTLPPFSGAVMSKTSFASKDWEGQSSEGKGGSSEKSEFTPLWRIDERQCLGARIESQVSFPASQLSSLTGVVSDASNNKSSSLERQQSVPLGGRLLSQNSSIHDQFIECSSKQGRPIICQRGGDAPHETPTLTMAKPEVKHEEGVKQEEGSSESQLASEHSGVDVSYAQSRTIEKQKSGAFPDLPWVTTTGKGPNGKTINGVMYIANKRHVRLVCSCHGKPMSPAEFVEHSGSTDLSNPERNIVVCPFPSLNNQLASTPV